jgi:hypothetical protein
MPISSWAKGSKPGPCLAVGVGWIPKVWRNDADAETSQGSWMSAGRVSAYVGQRQITSMVDVHTRKVRPIGVDRKACFLKISSRGGRDPELLTMRFWRGTDAANVIHFSGHDRTILQPSLENSLCRV